MKKYTMLEHANNQAQAAQRMKYRANGDYCLEMETAWFDSETGALSVRLPSGEDLLVKPWYWKHAGDFAHSLFLLSIEHNASPQNVYEFTFVASEFMRLAYDAEAMDVVSPSNRLTNFKTELGQQRVEEYAKRRLEYDSLCGWFVHYSYSSNGQLIAQIVRKLDVYGNRFIIKSTDDIRPARFIVDLEEMKSFRFYITERDLLNYGISLSKALSFGSDDCEEA